MRVLFVVALNQPSRRRHIQKPSVVRVALKLLRDVFSGDIKLQKRAPLVGSVLLVPSHPTDLAVAIGSQNAIINRADVVWRAVLWAASVKVFVVVVAAIEVTHRFYGFHFLCVPNAVDEQPINSSLLRFSCEFGVAAPNIGRASEQLDSGFAPRFLGERDQEPIAFCIISVTLAKCDIAAVSDEDVADAAGIAESSHRRVVIGYRCKQFPLSRFNWLNEAVSIVSAPSIPQEQVAQFPISHAHPRHVKCTISGERPAAKLLACDGDGNAVAVKGDEQFALQVAW